MSGRYTIFPFDLKLFEDRIQQGKLLGKNIRQIPSEELLVYLCIHGSKDSWIMLEAISSVAALIRLSQNLDWIRVEYVAQKMKCERMLLLGLFFAHDLLGAALPDAIIKRIEKDLNIKKIAIEIYKDLFLEKSEAHSGSINADFSPFHFKIRDNLLGQLRYALSLIFRPSRQEWRYFPIPALFSFFHYLLRPARLIWRFGCTWAR